MWATPHMRTNPERFNRFVFTACACNESTNRTALFTDNQSLDSRNSKSNSISLCHNQRNLLSTQRFDGPPHFMLHRCCLASSTVCRFMVHFCWTCTSLHMHTSPFGKCFFSAGYRNNILVLSHSLLFSFISPLVVCPSVRLWGCSQTQPVLTPLLSTRNSSWNSLFLQAF